jgi:anti-sigma factor RsiW
MNHQPFESWLLDDNTITPEQKRGLDAHLRACPHCAALLETGRALKSVKMVSPASGFTARFQTRLAARKIADRRSRFWGTILFVAGGLSLLMWIAGPYLASFLASPASWLSALFEWGVFLISTLQAMVQAGSVLLHVVPGFLSPFAWMILLSALAGLSLLWSVSIWRFAQWGVPRER